METEALLREFATRFTKNKKALWMPCRNSSRPWMASRFPRRESTAGRRKDRREHVVLNGVQFIGDGENRSTISSPR